MSVADQIRNVLAALALNKSQLADVLGVSRPTLYDWLDGKEPDPGNAERLAALLGLLARVGISSTTAINTKFVRQPIDEGQSLLEELRAEQWNEERLERLLRQARTFSDALDARLRNREERLRNLGYEELSLDQQRDLLNQNVALHDWPKPE